jgi:hydroxymethylpyrimidine/phosphomethylpyrimidine kinase
MVSQRGVIEAIVAGLNRWSAKNIVVDPVMVATSGDRLLSPAAIDALRGQLIPRAQLITPNLPEAAALLDEEMAMSADEIAAQGRRLLKLGCPAVLIKGGHAEGAESIDYLIRPEGVTPFAAKRIHTRNTHGTGCSLSSAIAAYLARGETLKGAIGQAKAYVSAAIAAADQLEVGHGHGPIHHFHAHDQA